MGAQVIHEASQTIPTGWRVALDSFIAERMQKPFAWGSNDCCIFAADAVLAMTGVNHATGLRGSYDGALQAARVVSELGGLSAIASRAGPECHPLCAGPGDVGLVTNEGRELLAVCDGAHWLAPTSEGLAAMPFESARAAWRAHG
jgi:hypothetical protein